MRTEAAVRGGDGSVPQAAGPLAGNSQRAHCHAQPSSLALPGGGSHAIHVCAHACLAVQGACALTNRQFD